MTDEIPPDLLALLDPELIEGALQMRAMTARFTPMSIARLAERREMLAAAEPALPPGVTVERRIIPGPADHRDLAVYIVNPQPGASRPGIVHMHGGGFTASSARGGVPGLQATAQALDCVIVSIDFRNAPEARWHQAIEDDHAGLLWTYRHAEALGIDPARIAIMGESGGGGHAALLAITARDRGQVPLCFQCLIYPMIDDRTGTSRPVPAHAGAFGWSAESNRFGWECFLGVAPGGTDVPAAAVPARIADLSGLPPTYIATGGLDLFASETIDYARRLNEAGVPTEALVVPGAYHGFDMIQPGAAVSRRFTVAKLDALRRAFGEG